LFLLTHVRVDSQIKLFVEQLNLRFRVGADTVRIGYIVFNSYIVANASLVRFSDVTLLNQAIDGLPYITGLTDTALYVCART
jgi:hypothetical protein